MGFGLLLMIAFWVGLIALGVWFVGALFSHASQPTPAAGMELSAQDILDRRFARGEMSRQEYDVMRQVISDRTQYHDKSF